MKIVGVAACTVGIAHTYMAQKAIQDECAARGIECKGLIFNLNATA